MSPQRLCQETCPLDRQKPLSSICPSYSSKHCEKRAVTSLWNQIANNQITTFSGVCPVSPSSDGQRVARKSNWVSAILHVQWNCTSFIVMVRAVCSAESCVMWIMWETKHHGLAFVSLAGHHAEGSSVLLHATPHVTDSAVTNLPT